MSDHGTLNTLTDFVSGAADGLLGVTPASATFPQQAGQTMQMPVADFGARFQEYRDWHAPSVVGLDQLFGGPEIEMNIGEPAAHAPETHLTSRRPSSPGLN